MRLWGGRFEGSTDERMADFTRSLEIDRALALDDLAGSAAHVRGLGRAGLLVPDEVEALLAGLDGLRREVEAGTLAWNPALEDVHMNLEEALALRIGALAGKLHTGRSRNDQVATDLRLWTRRTTDALDAALVRMERALVGLADREGDAVLPGTTHIQPAQPVLLAHHLLAYVEMLERDRGRLADGRRRANVSPLGSGALAGAGYPARPRGHRARARLRRRHRQLPGRRLGPRLRRRAPLRLRPRDGPPLAPGGGDHLVVEPALRLRADGRRLLDGLLDDAQQEEPRRGGAGPGPRRPRDRLAGRPPGRAQGAPPRVPAGPPGGQAAALRGVRHAGGVARRHGRDGRDARRRPGGDAPGGRRGVHHGDGGRGRARPARRPVPGGPPRRGAARGDGRTAGGRPGRPRGRRRWRPRSPTRATRRRPAWPGTRRCRPSCARPRRSKRRSPPAT